jgi:hypothetical protein
MDESSNLTGFSSTLESNKGCTMTEPKKTEFKFDNALSKVRALMSGGIKLSLIIFFLVIAWRIAWSEFSLDLNKFNFSDLLAMILALFAMAMSVAFYFKSTDSSNQFYDNIYNFTQKTSEILGRIEERFGERLRHLDEGYGRIESKIAKNPDEIQEKVKETEGKEEKEQLKLQETNEQMKKMIEKLAEKAQLQEQEKADFYQQMNKLTKEKDMAQERIRAIEEDRDHLKRQLMMAQEDFMEDADIPRRLLIPIMDHPRMKNILRKGAPSDIIRRYASSIISDFSEDYMEQLREAGIVNNRRELTTAGALMLRSRARKIHNL